MSIAYLVTVMNDVRNIVDATMKRQKTSQMNLLKLLLRKTSVKECV